MSLTARPTTLTSATWTGSAADLADGSDATYLESPSSPTTSDTFLCALDPLPDAGATSGHALTVRAAVAGAGPYDLVLALENSGDDSVIATRVFGGVSSVIASVAFTLTAGEAALVADYTALQVRGYVRDAVEWPFIWSAVNSATSYVLQVGPASGTYTTFDEDVGNVTDYELYLSSGTYYARVVPQGAGSATAEQTVVVP